MTHMNLSTARVFSLKLSTFNYRLSSISSETPALQARAPPPLPNPPASPDRPISPAPPADYPAASPASLQSSVQLAHPEKPAPPAPTPPSHHQTSPRQA